MTLASGEVALPILAHREEIRAALEKNRTLILCAPPGTGKSTQVPRFLLDRPGKILVLQPRRIAARNLALRVAEEMGEAVGNTVGYNVRFEGKSGPGTRILYQTYGVFFQQLLNDPALSGISAVLLDEFHERTLEADASLAWLRKLRSEARPDLIAMVMSATLELDALESYLDAPVISVDARMYPVDIEHQGALHQEPLPQQAARALKRLLSQGLTGSVLIFMPGQGEIRRTLEALDPICRQAGVGLFELHGSMDMESQQRALKAPRAGTCVIVSTNVAETSLTIPGVTAVIDSGQARIASYSPSRDMNTLYLGSISLQSARQRAGRAGRTAPGRCVRLWSADRERAMPKALDPEVLRVEPTSMDLSLHALLERYSRSASASRTPPVPLGTPPAPWRAPSAPPETTPASAGTPPAPLSPNVAAHPSSDAEGSSSAPAQLLAWLTAPSPALWDKAETALRRIGAVDPTTGRITAAGLALSRLPAHPVLAKVLLDSRAVGLGETAAAMVAVLESQSRRAKGMAADLYELGSDLASEPASRRFDRETQEAFRQLQRLIRGSVGAEGGLGNAGVTVTPVSESAQAEAARAAATRPWIVPFQDRIAVRLEKTQSFQLADGRKAVAEAGSLPKDADVILALELHESGGANQSRQVGIPTLLPCRAEWIVEAFPGECAWVKSGGWDAAKGRVVQEEQLQFRGMALNRRPLRDGAPDPAEAARLLAEKLIAGEIALPGDDEDAKQMVLRIHLAAKIYPDYGFPKMDEDDWHLIYHEACRGRASVRDLESVSLSGVLREYLGGSLSAFLDKAAPVSLKMPTGRPGRYTYSESAPPELSARLGDFIGMEGKTTLMDGKVEVIYDILAPNYRTVQKTADLTGFWKNTYPEVKKELKRRYPKHPWP